MPQHPSVSIGLPVYNGERYLALCVEAVLSQTHTDLELIISDNASTDGTRRICEDFAQRDSRVRYHRYEQNRGAAWNFNNTVALARGDFFKWQCYDDLVEPRMVEKCLEVLTFQPRVVLCCTKTRIIDENGDTTGFFEDNINIAHPRPHQRLRQYLFGRNKAHIMAQFGLIRRGDLAATRLMMSMPFSDVILMAELALRGQFREISGYDFVMRHHPLNSTRLYHDDPHALGVFLDPARQGKRVSLGLEKTREWFKVVGNSNLPFRERLMCHGVIARYVFDRAVPSLGHAALARSPR